MTCTHRIFGLFLVACLTGSPVPTSAETFFLADGRTIEGTAVRKVGGMLSIKLEGTGIERVKFDDLERVEFLTPEGEKVSAQIISWSKGVYQLSTDQGPLAVTVEDGKVVALVGQPVEGADDNQEQTEVATVEPSEPNPVIKPVARSPETINAGFIYTGLADDGGRNFMLEKGRQELSTSSKISETAFFEVTSKSDDQLTAAIDQLVTDGANLVFMTGSNATATVSKSAKQHADVHFVHCGQFDPAANVDVFCGRIYQARYLSGIIAGGMTSADLIGYIAAEPSPEILVGINAFALGVQSVNPSADVMVHWTSSLYAPGDAQRRARELIERGADILTIHQDSPAALQVAEQLGVDTIGFQSDMSAFAPSSTLTSAVWNWGEMYSQIVDQLNDADIQLRPTWLGLRDGVVDLAPISDRVPDDLRRLVQQRQREIIDGRLNVFTGPISDIDGDIRVLDGRIMTDESLLSMDYLIDGVVGY